MVQHTVPTKLFYFAYSHFPSPFKLFSLNIYLSNLHRKTTAVDIRTLFAAFGTVAVGKMTYVLDLRTRLPMGFVYVEMEDAQMGEKAIEKLNGSIVTGNKIVVKKAL
jgi:RNA recognition motif-containing protein